MKITSTYEKIQNICHHLNADAYKHQTKKYKKKLPKSFKFTPCSIADYILKNYKNLVLQPLIHNASMEFCSCHNSLSESDLNDLLFDDTAKLKYFKR